MRGIAEVEMSVATLAMRLPNEAKKTSRLMGLRKYCHFINVPMMKKEPIMDRADIVRSVRVMARNCCAVRAAFFPGIVAEVSDERTSGGCL